MLEPYHSWYLMFSFVPMNKIKHIRFYLHARLKINQVRSNLVHSIDSRQIGLPRMITIQVIDVNKDGIVDIKEYIVVTSLSSYLYKNSAVDYTLLDSKLQSLRVTRSLISQIANEFQISIFNRN